MSADAAYCVHMCVCVVHSCAVALWHVWNLNSKTSGFRYLTVLTGHGIHHKGALYRAVDIHPCPRLVSYLPSFDMHASDSSDTIGNIQVHLCHTVTRHTPLVKQLNVKMP